MHSIPQTQLLLLLLYLLIILCCLYGFQFLQDFTRLTVHIRIVKHSARNQPYRSFDCKNYTGFFICTA